MESRGLSRAAKRRKKLRASVTDAPQNSQLSAAVAPDAEHPQDDVPASVITPVLIESQPSSIASVLEADLDIRLKGLAILQNLITPTTVDVFYQEYYERKPLYIKRDNGAEHVDGLCSVSEIEALTKIHTLTYTTDVDICSSTPAPHASLVMTAPDTTATHTHLWERFNNGCALRFYSLERFMDPLWKFYACLEAYFNSKITGTVTVCLPGVKPHSLRAEGCDSLLIQIQGCQHVNLHSIPPTLTSVIRTQAQDVTQEDLGTGSSIPIRSTLSPGDLLYFPVGFAYTLEGCTDTQKHTNSPSLSVLLSFNRLNMHVDLLELILPQALASVMSKIPNTPLHRALPVDYASYMGVTHSDRDDLPLRKHMLEAISTALKQVVDETLGLVDAGLDQMYKGFIAERLPPPLLSHQEENSAHDNPDLRLTAGSYVRCVGEGVARLVVEDGKAVVYHCIDNSRSVDRGAGLVSPLEFELDDAPALETLIMSHEQPVRVFDLPHPPTEDIDDKISIAEALYKDGLLVVEQGQDDEAVDLLTLQAGKRTDDRHEEVEGEEDGDDEPW